MLTGYRVGHGQAVAVGIALDACYAARKGLIGEADRDAILEGLSAAGLPIWDDCLKQRREDGTLEVLAGLEQFREHLGGALTITLPDGIGRKAEVHQMSTDWIEDGVRLLRQRSETLAQR
ncbi:MAG: 3-dehydroquinate synthase family protein [Planctomycetota bacterium]|jgi:3-dehydroquinate synthase